MAGATSEVVPWAELTPQARVVLRDELERLLARVPARENVPVVRAEMIPHMVVKLRERLGVEHG